MMKIPAIAPAAPASQKFPPASGRASSAATTAADSLTLSTLNGSTTLYGHWNGNANAQVADATTYGQLQTAENQAASALSAQNSASSA